ncbi:MAG: type III-B CRISPR module RAMP protein Cmr4 [Chloroflexus sp.]|uniref:type III-B CRISPR module RAMP protein Cmr4 n=1 Tax=Chloroflexus sp. TaxID=1904827 RepID=UPI00404B2EA7
MATYKRQRYLLMTTDPVHIGTGGYRLGRVDNSIVREPGTRVPKIPGTSLHGAARSYAAQLYETPKAAGQSQNKVQDPGQNKVQDPGQNPVCYTFGYLRKDKSGDEEKTTAYSGVVNVFDAHVLLFPVHSLAGPVWVSTVERLREAGFKVENAPDNRDTGTVCVTWQRNDPLNLGWLMVKVGGQVNVEAPDPWKDEKRWQTIQQHIVLVHESLFSQVVNSNLEVRTSVSINPQTGAAEEGALFTYEAIPRATFLTAEVVLDDYRQKFPQNKCSSGQTDKGNPLPCGAWNGPLDVLKAGLRMIEWLGVGGMGTRGFGRIAIVGEPVEEDLRAKQDSHQPQGEEVSQ